MGAFFFSVSRLSDEIIEIFESLIYCQVAFISCFNAAGNQVPLNVGKKICFTTFERIVSAVFICVVFLINL